MEQRMEGGDEENYKAEKGKRHSDTGMKFQKGKWVLSNGDGC
jgi:hypothetical protein